LRLQNDARATLLQGVSALIAVGGVLVTLRINNQRGQATERFVSAINQLGNEQLEVRLGGIYALEQIAGDTASERETVVEILSGFVRTHAPWPPSRPGQHVGTAPIDAVPVLRVRAPDVQAALTVLGRGAGGHPPDLEGTDLRKASLAAGLNLAGAILIDANLQSARMAGVNLQRARFTNALMQHAYLRNTQMQGADLRNAQMEGAYLGDAQLQQANLKEAGLQGTLLRDAQLSQADLTRANLRGASLGSAQLDGANLMSANLQMTHLDRTQLRKAPLSGAQLQGAVLDKTDLQGAVLDQAQLDGTDFTNAQLQGADLTNVQLRLAQHLADAQLRGAHASRTTTWPEGFDPVAAGVDFVDAEPTRGP
jgi:uncharacterized protein YjbI with pentapeptide repeats